MPEGNRKRIVDLVPWPTKAQEVRWVEQFLTEVVASAIEGGEQIQFQELMSMFNAFRDTHPIADSEELTLGRVREIASERVIINRWLAETDPKRVPANAELLESAWDVIADLDL